MNLGGKKAQSLGFAKQEEVIKIDLRGFKGNLWKSMCVSVAFLGG